jgi:hypothetical protein
MVGKILYILLNIKYTRTAKYGGSEQDVDFDLKTSNQMQVAFRDEINFNPLTVTT